MSLPPVDMELCLFCLELQNFEPFGFELPLGMKRIRWSPNREGPFYFVASLDDDLYVSIRGAAQPCDFLSCLDMEGVDFKGGKVHRGIRDSAALILKEIRDLLDKCKGKVVLCGHSYGASCAAMIVTILRLIKPDTQAFAVCYAPLPIYTPDIAEKTAPYITSFVYGNDIVPRLTIRNVSLILSLFAPPGSGEQSLGFAQTMLEQVVQQIFMNNGVVDPSSQFGISQKIPNIVHKVFSLCSNPPSYEMVVPGRAYHFVPDGPQGENVTVRRFAGGDVSANFATLMTGMTHHNFQLIMHALYVIDELP